MKKYLISERQIEAFKNIYETFEGIPIGVENAINEEIEAQDGAPIHGIYKGILDGMSEPMRDFKFFIEDIEAQELDVRIEDDIKSDTRKKLLVAVYIPKEQAR